jgi:hypothetical protein
MCDVHYVWDSIEFSCERRNIRNMAENFRLIRENTIKVKK